MPTVRRAVLDDAAACAAIYAPYVEQTAITFELVVPTAEEIGQRIIAAQRNHDWLVLEDDGHIIGYAYAGPFRSRAAYDWSCETSIYLTIGRRRTGAGRLLYGALIQRLSELGYRIAVGVMTLPNEASVGLHKAMGFESVGVFHKIGFKLGAWHDVAWMQCPLTRDEPDALPTRRPGRS